MATGLNKNEAEIGLPPSAAAERQKLRKHFRRFDILFFLLCTIVGVDTIGTVASSGAEAFTWLIVLAVVFFIPSALLTAELGAAFPEEGGPYIWTSRAFAGSSDRSTISFTG
ncbi:amino acid permease [Actinacidiphila soli]|uniref:amino acid permease n=1 Tax=Actinacidiphila soli TaxID=2487275 RepID=UPI001F0BC2F8|nr:amino acid permease [Actinacidiphila soli]